MAVPCRAFFPVFLMLYGPCLVALLGAGLILYCGSYRSLQSVSRLLVAVIIFFIVYAVVRIRHLQVIRWPVS
ncbi:MAG: hypothetical protein SVV67_09180 [Bacillota bacterium]|nr:hypothetical protein [Bacillota bacterium]